MVLASFSDRNWLRLAAVAAVLGIGSSAGVEWWGITHVRDAVTAFQRDDVPLVEAVSRLHDDVLQLRRYEKDVFINIASEQTRDTYRSRWDASLLRLRFDLNRVRSLSSPSLAPRVQKVVDSVATYRSEFAQTYELITAGTIMTTQQANEHMARAKVAVHEAEGQLVDVERHVRVPLGQLSDPVSEARWLCLMANLLLIVIVGGPLALAVRRSSSMSPVAAR